MSKLPLARTVALAAAVLAPVLSGNALGAGAAGGGGAGEVASPIGPARSDVDAGGVELAQVVNPADAQRRPAASRDTTQTPQEREHRSWKLPEVVVIGERPHRLREEQRIGTYSQPRWTATRRFPSTRVYVVPEGKVEFEYWARPTWNNGINEMRSLWEMEFGLPHRFQLDLYLRFDQEGDLSAMQLGQQVEVRWAFAEWGRLWGNPTFYFEWVGLEERPDKIEPKLLLGGQLSEGWHAGLNFVAELELSGEREYEYEVTGGISRSVIDSKLSLGAETRCAFTDVAAGRGNFAKNIRLGPSLQYRPLPQMTLNIAPLFGLTKESDDAQVFFNTGYEF